MKRTKEDLIDNFAKRHRLKTKHDPCGEKIVPGKKGESHIFQYDNELLGVVIMPAPNETRTWNSAHKAFLKAGLTVTLDGDREGIATFDPGNKEQVRLAKKYTGISSRRKATSAQLAALAGYRATRQAQKQSDHVQVPSEPQRAILEAGRPHLSGGFPTSERVVGVRQSMKRAA
jgi:hypothetical protein